MRTLYWSSSPATGTLEQPETERNKTHKHIQKILQKLMPANDTLELQQT